MSTNRSSSSECSGSGITRAKSSKNAVFASLKEMPCLRRFAASLRNQNGVRHVRPGKRA